MTIKIFFIIIPHFVWQILFPLEPDLHEGPVQLSDIVLTVVSVLQQELQVLLGHVLMPGVLTACLAHDDGFKSLKMIGLELHFLDHVVVEKNLCWIRFKLAGALHAGD